MENEHLKETYKELSKYQDILDKQIKTFQDYLEEHDEQDNQEMVTRSEMKKFVSACCGLVVCQMTTQLAQSITKAVMEDQHDTNNDV